MNIVFAGTPDIAATCLQALLDAQHNVVAVYTQPDRPKGRGKHCQASPVKALAEKHGIAVYQPLSLKGEAEQAVFKSLDADIMVVVAYGLIIPKAILNAPKWGCINAHTSLLPKYRGAAPVQRAILHGETHTGVSIMQMDAGVDTGPVLMSLDCAIEKEDTSETLLEKLSALAARALLTTLSAFIAGDVKPLPQDPALASHAAKLTKEEAEIQWKNEATSIERAIRAYQPWPVAYSFLNNERVRILSATVVQSNAHPTPGEILAVSKQGLDVATGDGILRITRMQLPGKKIMSITDILNGHADLLALGACFHDAE